MDQYSKNLVDQIDQNGLSNVLKLTKMNEGEVKGYIRGVGIS